MLWHPRCRWPATLSLPPTLRIGPRKNATPMFPVVQGESATLDVLVECPKRGDGQDWDGSHLLELLPIRDILIAARDCQGSWPRHPAHDAALSDEVIEQPATSPNGMMVRPCSGPASTQKLGPGAAKTRSTPCLSNPTAQSPWSASISARTRFTSSGTIGVVRSYSGRNGRAARSRRDVPTCRRA